MRLFIDQYGDKVFAETVKELRQKTGGGGGRVHKMYVAGSRPSLHIGYVVGQHWYTEYKRVERRAE